MKEVVDIIKEKLNTCQGLGVAFITKSKIGKVLSSISKSPNTSKTIKASVDDLIQDWKEKFVQEGHEKKKSSSTAAAAASGEKRKRSDSADSPPTENTPALEPIGNLHISVPKKSKYAIPRIFTHGTAKMDYSDSSSTPVAEATLPTSLPISAPTSIPLPAKKKKRVSWSAKLEHIKMIDPRQPNMDESIGNDANQAHKTVQELMNEEKSKERQYLTQQKQRKQFILTSMKNTVNYSMPRLIYFTDNELKEREVFIDSPEAKRINAEVSKNPISVEVRETPSSPVQFTNPVDISSLLTNIGIIPAGTAAAGTNRFPVTQQPVFTNYPQQPPPSHRPPPPTSPYSSHPPPQVRNHQHDNRHDNRRKQQPKKSQPVPPPVLPPGEKRVYKPIKCLYYQKGTCKNGIKCPYYHEGLDPPPEFGVEEYDFEKAKYFQSLKSSLAPNKR